MEEWMDLIEARPEVHGGRLVFRGTRIPVDLVLEMMASGLSFDNIIEEYPRLTRKHLEAALAYSAKVLKGEVTSELLPRYRKGLPASTIRLASI